MPSEFQIGERLGPLVDRVVESYFSDERTRHIDRAYLPSRAEVVQIIELLLELGYPGYYGRQGLNRHNVRFHVGELLPRLGEKLFDQIYQALCYQQETNGQTKPGQSPCDAKARELTMAFLEKIPAIREQLAGDVQAAYDGDPAAVNTDEVVLAYPGVLAVTVYRFAHELHLMGVPLIPRTMTEWAHQMTGVDIHPGARIGRNFFIDHATGVVIGETSEIGSNVKLYQGVTLGALSFPKDERGRLIRGHKRHPTLKDRVTLYANATVLGGETVLGENSMVGASVFLTSSIPDNAMVRLKDPELRIRKLRPDQPDEPDWAVDFQI
ncbi:MAG: serine acetyltransferase [Planctomycetes bacterium]|nr:serine acetyltransferase [Planctomycetota bacterium]